MGTNSIGMQTIGTESIGSRTGFSKRCAAQLFFALFMLLLSACGGAAGAGKAESPSGMAHAQPEEREGASEASVESTGLSEQFSVQVAAPSEPIAAAGPSAAPSRAPTDAQQNTPAPTQTADHGTEERATVVKAAPSDGPQPPTKPMLDIEAKLDIEVENVVTSARDLRELVSKTEAQIVNESIVDQRGGTPRANYTLRVPVEHAYDILDRLATLGAVRSRSLNAKDISKQFFDAALRLHNFEITLRRYQELLARASHLNEVMQLEQQLDRIRGQIEQVKGEMRFMRERTSFSPVHVSLFSKEDSVVEVVNPEAKLFPGVRVTYLGDFRGEDGRAGYLGAGISVRLSRHLSIDLDGLRDVDSSSSDLQAFFVTLGGELYSEFFGEGTRRFFNPFVGLRGGYARFLGKNEALAGGTVGVEIFKSETVTFDFDTRLFAIFGSDAGLHVGVQPSLGFNVAF